MGNYFVPSVPGIHDQSYWYDDNDGAGDESGDVSQRTMHPNVCFVYVNNPHHIEMEVEVAHL